MSFLKSWFTDRSSPEGASHTASTHAAPAPDAAAEREVALSPESAPVGLPAVMAAMREALLDLDPATLDTDVVRAKVADLCRGLSITPLDPLVFEHLTKDLDRGAWDRMGLLVLVMERGALGDGLKKALSGRVRSAVRGGLIEASKGPLELTLELVRSAPLRLEELSRRFVLGLGASIAGEPLEASKKALERLDYGRLLAEADRAKRAAAERGGR